MNDYYNRLMGYDAKRIIAGFRVEDRFGVEDGQFLGLGLKMKMAHQHRYGHVTVVTAMWACLERNMKNGLTV